MKHMTVYWPDKYGKLRRVSVKWPKGPFLPGDWFNVAYPEHRKADVGAALCCFAKRERISIGREWDIVKGVVRVTVTASSLKPEDMI